MIRCIALDDDPMAIEIVETYCKAIPFLQFEKSFTHASAAQMYLRKFPVDLLFLDIRMPEINGIDFVRSIQQACMVIFTTASSEYAVEAFELHAVDYLLKPLREERFIRACNRAKDYFEIFSSRQQINSSCLYIRSEYSLVKIPFSDIYYLETMDDYIKIYQIGKKPILTLMSMKKMLELLPNAEFIRVHRSYIVAINKIESVRAKSISMGVTEIPIGASYEKDFFLAYMKDYF